MADSPSGPTPPSGRHRNGSISRDSVPVRSYVSLSPRPHGVPRRLFTVGQDSATAAFPSIRCRCGRRVVGRRSRPGNLRLRRSHFAMSSISPKFISLIIKDIHFKNLLDPAYFATKRPFCPISSQVQQMFFSECLIIRYFCKRTLLDVRYTSTPEV